MKKIHSFAAVVIAVGFLLSTACTPVQEKGDILPTQSLAGWKTSDYTAADVSEGRIILSADDVYVVYGELRPRFAVQLSANLAGGEIRILFAASDIVFADSDHIAAPADQHRLEWIWNAEQISLCLTDGRTSELLAETDIGFSGGLVAVSTEEGEAVLRLDGKKILAAVLPERFAEGGYPGFGIRGDAVLRLGRAEERR